MYSNIDGSLWQQVTVKDGCIILPDMFFGHTCLSRQCYLGIYISRLASLRYSLSHTVHFHISYLLSRFLAFKNVEYCTQGMPINYVRDWERSIIMCFETCKCCPNQPASQLNLYYIFRHPNWLKIKLFQTFRNYCKKIKPYSSTYHKRSVKFEVLKKGLFCNLPGCNFLTVW